MPPKPIRTLRNLTRYRKTQISDRQREALRLHKILEDSGIKLGCVATDILGKSGRDMLDALVGGTIDPVVLADLARGQLRKKIRALREALEGCFDDEHALVVGQILAHIDVLDDRDQGDDDFTRQNPDKTTKRLVRQLEALGHRVTLEAREVAA